MAENSANSYVVPVSLDTSDSVRAVNDLLNSLENVNNAAAASGQTGRQAMQNTTNAANAASNAVEDVAESMGEASEAAKGLKDNATAAGNATRQSMNPEPIKQNVTWWQRVVGVVKSFAQGVKEGYQEAVDGARKARDEEQKLQQQREKSNKKTKEDTGGLNGLLSKGAGLVAGYFSVQAIVAFGKQIIETTALFEKMQATLTVALGSGSAAEAAMSRLQDFAAKTPFGVEEITNSFIKLVNRGFVPTNAELTKLGDLAASQGKSMDQLIEAVLDAQTGEFERLKEFGIRASQANGQVTLSFKGVTQTIKLNDEAIRNVILSYGNLEGVLGTMGAVSETTGGKISNLSDSWQQFVKTLGDVVKPAIIAVLEVLNGVVGSLKDMSDYLKGLTPGAAAAAKGMEAYQTTTNRLLDAFKRTQETAAIDVDKWVADSKERAKKVFAGNAEQLRAAFQEIDAQAALTRRGRLTFKAEQDQLVQDLTNMGNTLEALTKKRQATLGSDPSFKGLVTAEEELRAQYNQTRQAFIDFSVQQAKADAQRKQSTIPTAAELLKAEQERLKAERLANEQTKQRIALEKQLRDEQAKGNDNKYQVQQDQLAAVLESATAELDNQARVINQSKKLSADQAKSLELINKIKIQLQENYYKDSIRLAEQYTLQQVTKEFEYQSQVLALQKDTRAKALADVDLWEKQQMQAAREQYADDLKRRTDLQFEIAQAAERKRKEVTNQFDTLDIQQEAELQEALEQISSKYADRSLKSEREKQKAILNIKIDAAEQQLKLLDATGTTESKIQAAQLRKVIADMRKELGDLKNPLSDKGPTLFEFLGMGEDDIKKLNNYIDKMEAIGGIISNVTKVITANIEKQIAAKDAQIQKYNEEIDVLQQNVDEQRELSEEGKANSLENAEDELAQKQKLRDEEIKQKEELQKKAEKLQTAQLILDTISQASNLVTAASKIFAAYADIPFVGVALAAAAVVAMIAAFASAKSSASSAVSSSYGEGGFIDGASHETTGVKYRSISRGVNRTIELEGGEHVTRKRSAQKHRRVLEAINNDDFSSIPYLDPSVVQMLKEMGVGMPDYSAQAEALNTYQDLQTAPVIVYNAGTGKTEAILNAIRGDVNYIAEEKKREEKVLYEDDKVKRIKIGNRTRLIHKKHG
jgi:hypothetical protein